jgi:hypothetical protein
MGTATGYSPKRHGTSALAGQQGSHVPADTEAAQDAPHGDRQPLRRGSGQAPATRGCAAGRPSRATSIRGTSDHLGPMITDAQSVRGSISDRPSPRSPSAPHPARRPALAAASSVGWTQSRTGLRSARSQGTAPRAFFMPGPVPLFAAPVRQTCLAAFPGAPASTISVIGSRAAYWSRAAESPACRAPDTAGGEVAETALRS